jgi:ditrans,polycis-polyprenyl diphosphate synthase
LRRSLRGLELIHTQILEVCYKAGVTHVTIYAFSIENFKRSKYEVDALMDMAKLKLTQLSQHGDLLDQYGASIRILGQRDLVKPDVLKAVDKAVEMTSRNGNAVLNVCFPYTSRDEMTTAIRSTVEEWSKPLPRKKGEGPFKEERIARKIRDQNKSSTEESKPHLSPSGTILSPSSSTTSLTSSADSTNDSPSSLSSTTTLHQPPSPQLLPADTESDIKHTFPTTNHTTYYPSPESITSSTLTSHMFTADNPPLDLLVRTSSVHRLSDFMLWQCHQHTEIAFLDVLWPEFDLWSFLPVLWEWQWRQKKRHGEEKGARQRSRSDSSSRIKADRKRAVGHLRAESLD